MVRSGGRAVGRGGWRWVGAVGWGWSGQGRRLGTRDGTGVVGSGAGQLFGVTGGVMEAAVRTVYAVVTEGETMPR